MRLNFLRRAMFFLTFLFLAPVFVYLFSDKTSAQEISLLCDQIAGSNNVCDGMSNQECRALLEKCAAYYDEQSAAIAQDMSKTQQQKNTLQTQIGSIKKKISSLNYQINQSKVIIKDLSLQIKETGSSINATTGEIQGTQKQIASILRMVYEQGQRSPVIVLLEGNLSDYFSNLTYMENLNSRMSDLLDSAVNLKSYLESQKIKQEDEESQLQKAVQIQTLQKQENERSQKEREGYLKLTEAQYQQQLKEKRETERKASEIRARIFELIGVVKAPTFGEAVDIAKYVSGATGVRAAFLLAILQQESAIGKNVGQCNIADMESGASVSIKSGTRFSNGIHKTRDLPLLVAIAKELGRDPLDTPISCPIPNIPGYGGAMGPAQFIPSTWMLYKNRLEGITGKTADPWNIKDSFLAAGLYLENGGAGKKTRSAEYCAALAYFSGSCSAANQKKFGFYANQVLNRADAFEKDIQTIGG